MSDSEFASKGDLHRVEGKVDALWTGVRDIASDIRSVSEKLAAREALEKQAQILLAEVNTARATAAAEKTANAEAWTSLKTRALWTAMTILLLVSFPGLAELIRKMKGVIP